MRRFAGFLPLLLTIMAFSGCKTVKNSDENPFFTEWDTPYGVPPFDRIAPEHFMPAFERGMSLHAAEIDAIVSNNDAPTFETVFLPTSNGFRPSKRRRPPCWRPTPTASCSTSVSSPKSRRSTTGVRRSGSMPSRAGCCRRPTTRSCGRAPCSTIRRNSA